MVKSTYFYSKKRRRWAKEKNPVIRAQKLDKNQKEKQEVWEKKDEDSEYSGGENKMKGDERGMVVSKHT